MSEAPVITPGVAPVTPPVVAPVADPAATWYTGADQELVGHVQNRGWDKLTPAEVALQAAKAHHEASKLIGADPNSVIKLPKPEDAAAWKQVWQKLGAPADPKEYDFSTVKFQDGSELSDDFASFVRNTAAELNLPKDAATRIAAAFVKFQDDAGAFETATRSAQVKTEQDELARNWGPHAEANRFIAKNTALKLGVTEAEFDALSTTPGGAKALELFRNIGSKIGEDKFITNGNPVGGSAMTAEQAVARKAELMRDESWVQRYNKGDTAAISEMKALLVLITGESDAGYRAA